MRIFTSFRRTIATISLIAIVSQIIFPAFTFAANPSMSTTLTQANVPPEAQIVQLTVPRDLNPGDSLVFTLSGTTVVQSFDTSSDVTLSLLNVKIDAVTQVSSTVDIPTRTFTVTSATPGTGFPTPTLDIQAAGRNFSTLVNNIVAVAQEAEFHVTANLIPGDTVGVTVAGTGIIQNFSGNTAATLTSLASQITSDTSVTATYSGATGKVHLKAKVAGNAFSLSNIVTGSSDVASHVVQPNVVPVAQVNTLTLPRTIDSGETISLSISGSGVTQSYTGSSTHTIDELVNQIDALDLVNATVTGNVITITAATPGIPFSLSPLSVTGGTGTLVPVQPNVIAVAQVDVISFSRNFVV